MKRSTLVVILGSVAALALSAQTVDLHANVPFEFRMGNTVMPAGEYGIHESNGVLTVRTAAGPAKGAMILVRPASRAASDKRGILVFNRYGNDYFLAKVWAPSDPAGYSLPAAKFEKEVRARTNLFETADVALRTK